MKFAAIHRQIAEFAVLRMCGWLDVSRAGYYAWVHASKRPLKSGGVDLETEVEKIYKEHRGRYGSPRVLLELARRGIHVGKRRVEKVMRERGMVGRTRRRFVKTTITGEHTPFADNLLKRDFSTTGPNQKWVSDLTYVDTDEGWLYLAGIQDLYSGRIVGWAADDNMETALCLEALRMAVETRQPLPGLIHHSDRGTQYTSQAYRSALVAAGITCSMSRRGQCWDNSPAESFWARLKEELFPMTRWKTKAEALAAIKEYVDGYYNIKRIKIRLGFFSPVEYEVQHGLIARAA